MRFWNRLLEKRLTKKVLPYTLVSSERIHNLYALAQWIEMQRIPGDVIECGVCNGGTAAVLANSASHSSLNRTVWLLDSFQGMPKTTPKDGVSYDGHTAEEHIGKEVGDPARVREVLRLVNADMNRVRGHGGRWQ